ncbi:Nesprin-1 [Bienertia sinuspersici]
MATSSIYKIKGIAMNLFQGGHNESYTNLPQYCELLMNSNHGSFKSIFVSFAAQFRGLIAGYRGLVDGNNEIFPVAAEVVDSENKKIVLIGIGRNDWTIMSDRQKGIDPSLDSIWSEVPMRSFQWLLKWNDWTIMSDRQKGIDPSLDSIWSKVPRRYCARHLCKNFKTDYPAVRRIAMVRHATRQQLSEQWADDGMCPNVVYQLRKLTKASRMCQAYPRDRGMYEIHDVRVSLPVLLNSMTCVCGRWQISGIPCKHGIKAILTGEKTQLIM